LEKKGTDEKILILNNFHESLRRSFIEEDLNLTVNENVEISYVPSSNITNVKKPKENSKVKLLQNSADDSKIDPSLANVKNIFDLHDRTISEFNNETLRRHTRTKSQLYDRKDLTKRIEVSYNNVHNKIAINSDIVVDKIEEKKFIEEKERIRMLYLLIIYFF